MVCTYMGTYIYIRTPINAQKYEWPTSPHHSCHEKARGGYVPPHIMKRHVPGTCNSGELILIGTE